MVFEIPTGTLNVLIGAGIGFVGSAGVELLRGWLQRERMREALLVEVNIIGRSLEEYCIAYRKHTSENEEYDRERPWLYAGMKEENAEYVSELVIKQIWRRDDPLQRFSQKLDSSFPMSIYTSNASKIGHLTKYESNELQRFYTLIQGIRESIDDESYKENTEHEELYNKNRIDYAMDRRKRASSVLSASYLTRLRWFCRGEVPVMTEELLNESSTEDTAPAIELDSEPDKELNVNVEDS